MFRTGTAKSADGREGYVLVGQDKPSPRAEKLTNDS